eukprot:TRINITY_DN17833_c0_g1_i1.p1 TRINITY_DN17833_c0_g1~~TRINITY_DN17833_c0_g1_i1.p1  ORF type:complete len:491 (+),score=201.33 TRINITY_DN17833_c0_g1_i1:49-1473(+)
MGIELPVRVKFQELTLLNDEHAKKILDTVDGDVTSAIPSFAQNLESLPLSAWAESQEGNWEAKAKDRKQCVRIQKVNEICHEVYSHVFEVKETAKRHGGSVEEAQCWKLLRENKWSIVDAITHLGVKFNSKPFLREEDFGEREFTKAALLNEDRGFLASAGETPFDLTKDFVDLLGDADRSPAKLVEIKDRDGQQERVIIQDCIRTFAGHDHRKRLEVFLNGAYQEFGNYSQGMAHVAAFLLMTLQEDDVMAILRRINIEIIPGHWKHESDGFGANAYVYQELVKKHFPECNKHFMEVHNILPEVYTRKWFCGLGLHCLDVELVYRFLRNLLKRGFEYLIAFGMSVMEHFKEDVLKVDNPGTLIDLMALDLVKAGVSREDQEAILDLADKADYTGDLGTPAELKAHRTEMYDKHLKERLERAREMIQASADDDDQCQSCENGPARWSDEDEDGLLLCDTCRVKYEAMGHEITEW